MEAKKSTENSLHSNDLALLGLKEMLSYYWLDIDGLGLVSMLSVRARQLTLDDRYWRVTVRQMFPQHPFEVNLDG